MHISAKVDYAVRAVVELAGSSRQSPRRLRDIAEAQAIPLAYLGDILTHLRSAGVVSSQRGSDGGYWLALPAEEVNLGSIIRAVEGALIKVRGQVADEIEYVGSAVALREVWIAVRNMLELVSVAGLAAGELPRDVLALTGSVKSPEQPPAREHASLA